MDRRNGGSNHLAPPRPPKSIPRVHRPRAPDPDTVDTVDSSPSIHIISTHPPSISRMNSNIINNSSSSINSSSNSTTTTTTTTTNINHRSIPSFPPPVTAPLTPLQNCRNSSNNNNNNSNSNNLTSSTTSSTISTFSRRRTEMTPQQRISTSATSTSSTSSTTTNSNIVQRSLTPSLITPTANLISNAINAVVRRSPSPVNSNNNINSNSNSVTLQLPRPENERLPNEYVDTPFTNPNQTKLTTPGSRHSLATSTVPNRNNNQLNGHTISIIDGTSVLNNNNNINNNNNSNLNNNINNSNKINLPNRTAAVQRPNLLPITKQPSFRNTNTISKKDASVLHQQFSHCPEDNIMNSQNATNNNGLIISNASDRLNSITCPQCNRCRCEECQRPRQLPYKWICNDNFLCSAETIIDYASCLCCVKGLYYHCAKDHELDCDSETIRCAEDPCSCAPYKRASRWGCLSALSLLLPCLLCYWPMRGCVSLCAKCYAKHSRHGCRCNNNSSSANNSRLNIINLASSPGQDQISNHHYHRQSSNINDLTPEKRLLANEY
ncbi:protein sprouty [Chironomus tepperi]|uniref:protein sprouty n=1 Tax=Chironomus tepperi TaxID=113505 RepID=UPI00391F7076